MPITKKLPAMKKQQIKRPSAKPALLPERPKRTPATPATARPVPMPERPARPAPGSKTRRPAMPKKFK